LAFEAGWIKMSEISFARSFLSTLDSRPSRLSRDHVEDPQTYPARGAYTLPKMTHPMTKRQKIAPGQERSLTVTLKSLRNPPLNIVLESQSPLISILDLKNEVSSQASIPVDKIKILHNKKPVGDAKVLKDVVAQDEASVEFSVMVIGGAASIKKDDSETTAPVAQGPSGEEVLQTQEFWDDLKGFLTQRLKDEQEGEKLLEVFKKSWQGHA